MGNKVIRALKEEEYPLLEIFLYEAIYQRENETKLPFEIIKDHHLNKYIAEFGKGNDICLVAEEDKSVIGMVWTRLYSEDNKGYGFVDGKTPELSIAILKDYRGIGVGTTLMKSILNLLREEKYSQVSLSVQKDNYAYKLYEQVGFRVLIETASDCVMVCELT